MWGQKWKCCSRLGNFEIPNSGEGMGFLEGAFFFFLFVRSFYGGGWVVVQDQRAKGIDV